jgi:hypothetical protein
MEHRDNGLMVDFSGISKQEKELGAYDQETRLMHAMNEIREYTPKSMTPAQREMFNVLVEKIFRKHGIAPESYAAQFGHLGTPQNLKR